MTYSIVARDADTGEIGVAVQTAVFGVGSVCPWAEAGIGAVSTQAWSRKSHGPSGLLLMRNGHTAPQALDAVLAGDPDREVRQVGMIDADGNAASHTGAKTIRYAGHQVGENYAVQANMMLKDTVPAAMAKAFEETSGSLLLRLMAALKAAQAEGGDFRGQQSAALKVVEGKLYKNSWEGVIHELRVEDDENAVAEMERLVNRQTMYALVYGAIEQAEAGQVDVAMKEYEAAVRQDSDTDGLQFWFALTMANEHGQLHMVKDILQRLMKADSKWVEHVVRMNEAREFKSKTLLNEIMELVK